MPRILLIEDNPGDARLISELLKEIDTIEDPYVITHVERVGDAKKQLLSEDFDIVLSDITLPDSRGKDTLKTISQASASLPIIFMTGTNDEALALTAIHQGAQDYIVKGSKDSAALSKALQYAQERKRFQNDLDKAKTREAEDLQKIQLLAAQKRQLEALNHAKDEFVSLASHQLRTPATAVKQYIGMILEGFVGDVDQKQLPLLQTAYDSNDRQLDIINELLKTAQIDSSQASLDIKTVNITAIVNDVLANHQAVLNMRHQNVFFNEIAEHTALADATEIRLVIENIIENASKYTPPHKAIHISFTEKSDMLRLCVRDEGVGISKGDQSVIFDKFTRIDNELSDTVSGTGLGLYWVKRIMHMHKGCVYVESDGKNGSSFTLELPR